ncbi:Molybdopterin-synthase sulfurtransferase [Eremomyces bilateralis CBS 781.70]|uniref:Adenylyltransferase and sulfurtransferase uba4 n=1 Tax=Eremomyces bilateralis CBS 781.70 TaxID=1392243 RepID=A0A6G1FV25_9PEZI|nr:Molybdopterin-synthase sulfurtransferase [Eremomyces bilateralis CBS 781.70]KAF1809613.1 Molybdopterin-synthase sulfurtransferase [Eremomyces bilateralis CBS 781.70]
MDQTIRNLREQISLCERQLHALKVQLNNAEERAILEAQAKPEMSFDLSGGGQDAWQMEILGVLGHESPRKNAWPLMPQEYKRYGRQLILPEIGLNGQLRLKNTSVLIVGVGGLGCPAAAYLAGAGVGTIGLVDGDIVEESNLHRQTLHTTEKVGMSKVDSATFYLKSLNPTIKYVSHRTHLNPQNAPDIFRHYDLVLDCTDNPASRYLISDLCVLLGKTLVSASALRMEGQLLILNYPPRAPGDSSGGPCYRCVFPKPPPAETVVTCGEGGVLGPVVGVMGVLQALEAIKVIVDDSHLLSSQSETPSLLLFSAYGTPPFRSIRLRSRRPRCACCSEQPSVSLASLSSGSLDYQLFCGIANPANILNPRERVSPREYAKTLVTTRSVLDRGLPKDHVLIDVRERVQFDLCSIEGSINIPFSQINAPVRSNPSTREQSVASSSSPSTNPDQNAMEVDGKVSEGQRNELVMPWVHFIHKAALEKPIYVVCRFGNDSQVTVKKFKEAGLDLSGRRWVGDIKNGLRGWRTHVDKDFPEY